MEPAVKTSESVCPQQIAVTTADEVSSSTGRRRPGRLEAVSPNLLPLLRRAEREQLPPVSADLAASADDIDVNEPPLSPVSHYESPTQWFGEGEGTVVGVALGTLLWGVIGWITWVLF